MVKKNCRQKSEYSTTEKVVEETNIIKKDQEERNQKKGSVANITKEKRISMGRR